MRLQYNGSVFLANTDFLSRCIKVIFRISFCVICPFNWLSSICYNWNSFSTFRLICLEWNCRYSFLFLVDHEDHSPNRSAAVRFSSLAWVQNRKWKTGLDFVVSVGPSHNLTFVTRCLCCHSAVSIVRGQRQVSFN